MSTSSVIGSMQSALDCAGKCDCCDKLQRQIDTLKRDILSLKGGGSNSIQSLVAVAVGAALTTQLKPAVNAAMESRNFGFQQTLKQMNQAIAGTERNSKAAVDTATNTARTVKNSVADTANIKAALDTTNKANEAKFAQIAANQAKYTPLLESIGGGGSTTVVTKSAFDERLAIEVARRDALLKAQAERFAEVNRLARLDADLVAATANQANLKAGQALNQVTNVAASTAKSALDASTEISGLRNIVNGFGAQVNALGKTIGRLETAVGNALVKAAEAVGISKGALAATGRLAGQVLQIFNVIGTIFTILDGMATRIVLGERIDAVENGVVALGNDLSRVLGKLLGLQNRIGNNETTIAQVKNIALDAKGIGEAANLKAGAAQVTSARAQGLAESALGNARQAQLTADGAVRNAVIANDNATTAYKKANEAQGIGEQAKRIAGDALGKAGVALTTALTAIALYQTVKSLRGIPGIPGRQGERGLQGIQGVPGRDGITTVVQVPGTPGRDGRNGVNGLPGRNGRDGRDVNPADVASLKALIVSQHAATRANINTTTSGLVNGVKGFFTTQLAGITALITAIAKNTYVEKALAVLTFAATIHNALMLSNNLAQTLGTIIDQVLGFILPKGLDGTPLSIGNVLGKVAHEIIADTVGEANYQHISEDWAKANRIYQASVNVFNQIGNAVGLVTAGMEVIGGNVAKIGNALKVWGAIGEKAYSWMNPQPNFKGKFFNFINTATAEANTIAMMVAIPIGISAAAVEINSSVGAVKKELDQEDPKDDQGHPITDKLGNPLKWEPGVTVPDPMKTILAQEQAKADSKNIIQATLEDIFDGGD